MSGLASGDKVIGASFRNKFDGINLEVSEWFLVIDLESPYKFI